MAVTADAQLRLVEREEIEKIIQTDKDTLHTHNFLFFDPVLKQKLFT